MERRGLASGSNDVVEGSSYVSLVYLLSHQLQAVGSCRQKSLVVIVVVVIASLVLGAKIVVIVWG